MSPTLNGSSMVQCFEHGDVIKIHGTVTSIEQISYYTSFRAIQKKSKINSSRISITLLCLKCRTTELPLRTRLICTCFVEV